jgi:hypothetical protein
MFLKLFITYVVYYSIKPLNPGNSLLVFAFEPCQETKTATDNVGC